jgi:hypothetical protein
MGITMFGFGGVMASMHGLMASWFAQTPLRAARRDAASHPPARGKPHLVRPGSARSCSSRSTGAAVNPVPSRTLRVVRVMESRHARGGTGIVNGGGSGRMVISGRMADVCAELDRLAALEAAAT